MGTDVKVALKQAFIASNEGANRDWSFPSGYGTPKAVLVAANKKATSNGVIASLQFNLGTTTTGRMQNIGLTELTTQSTSLGNESARENTSMTSFIEGGNSGNNRITHDSFGADYWRAFCDEAGTGGGTTHNATALAFTGADCNIVNGSFNYHLTAASSVTWTHDLNTTFGAGTNYLVIMYGNNQPIGTTSQQNNRGTIGIGFAMITNSGSTIKQVCAGWCADDAVTTSDLACMTCTDATSNFCMLAPDQRGSDGGAGADYNAYRITSATNNAITVETVNAGNGVTQFGCKVMVVDLGDTLKGDVFTIDTPTSTGTWTASHLSFKPQLIGVIQTYLTAHDTDTSDSTCDAFSLGFAAQDSEGVKEIVYGWAHRDGVGSAEVDSFVEAQAFKTITNTGGSNTTRFDATSLSFTSTGWSTTVNTTDGTARKLVGFAIEAQPAAAPPSGAGNLLLLGVGA